MERVRQAHSFLPQAQTRALFLYKPQLFRFCYFVYRRVFLRRSHLPTKTLEETALGGAKNGKFENPISIILRLLMFIWSVVSFQFVPTNVFSFFLLVFALDSVRLAFYLCYFLD